MKENTHIDYYYVTVIMYVKETGQDDCYGGESGGNNKLNI